MHQSLFVIIPPVPDIDKGLLPYEPVDSVYTIVDMIMTFVIDMFNGFLKASTAIIEYLNTPVEGIAGSHTPLELMLGDGLVFFLSVVLVAWVIDIVG